jgi:hypothetical protein
MIVKKKHNKLYNKMDLYQWMQVADGCLSAMYLRLNTPEDDVQFVRKVSFHDLY